MSTGIPESTHMFAAIVGDDSVMTARSEHVRQGSEASPEPRRPEAVLLLHTSDHVASAVDGSRRPTEEQVAELQARRCVHDAALTVRLRARGYLADVCDSISRLPEDVDAARRDTEPSGLIAPIAGHVDDGTST
jgi:hypothetical protein